IDAAPVRSQCGLRFVPDGALAEAPERDMLLITGGSGSRIVDADRCLPDGIRLRAAGARRVVPVCTALYILAANCLLDGWCVTTRWPHADALARRYPHLVLDADPLFVRDGPFHRAGGL